jgi:putative flippase GtrA
LRKNNFIRFTLFSGVGWIIDLVTFSLLVNKFHIQPFYANFISSYIGITFVWFMALNAVFEKKNISYARYLLTYWTFQLFSITFYSELLNFIFVILQGNLPMILWTNSQELLSKIIVTPLNLFTNYIFMKNLTKLMKSHIN